MSPRVQGSPSTQPWPSDTGSNTQPVSGWQRSDVQTLPSSQLVAVVPTQVPLFSQRSSWVHWLSSSQRRSFWEVKTQIPPRQSSNVQGLSSVHSTSTQSGSVSVAVLGNTSFASPGMTDASVVGVPSPSTGSSEQALMSAMTRKRDGMSRRLIRPSLPCLVSNKGYRGVLMRAMPFVSTSKGVPCVRLPASLFYGWLTPKT